MRKSDKRGFVYSTDPNFQFEHENNKQDTIPLEKQKLRVRLETKQRGGKAATLIAGFIGKDEDLQELSKKLKNHCGTGGSAKDGEILVQGDQRPKVVEYLKKLGVKDVK